MEGKNVGYDGFVDGDVDGGFVGDDGKFVGETEGIILGISYGAIDIVGSDEGAIVGISVGTDGNIVGTTVGVNVGFLFGVFDGITDGFLKGLEVGRVVGKPLRWHFTKLPGKKYNVIVCKNQSTEESTFLKKEKSYQNNLNIY